MGKLIVELPDEIHGELKKRAAVDRKTQKEIVTNLIKKYLIGTQKHGVSKKKTGLCGMWEDGRSAEEIIRDIKSHRKWFAKHGR